MVYKIGASEHQISISSCKMNKTHVTMSGNSEIVFKKGDKLKSPGGSKEYTIIEELYRIDNNFIIKCKYKYNEQNQS